jgi:hypothetical protein
MDPISILTEILKGLNLTKDQQAKLAAFEKELSEFRFKLAASEKRREDAEDTVRRLSEELSENVRIFRGAEFRKGRRTKYQWMMFCPVCHSPTHAPYGAHGMQCVSSKCGWISEISWNEVGDVLKGLDKE